MNVIGVTGPAGSGKDTAADHLVSHHRFLKISLADPLKRMARDVYGFTDDQLWGPSSSRNAPDKRYLRERHERHDWHGTTDGGFTCTRCALPGEKATPECLVYLTPRLCLQLLGTEWGRTCYENTWTELALRNARAVLEDGKCYTPQRGLYDDPQGPRPAGVVIADVRFWNELEAVKNVGGSLWRIKPPPTFSADGDAWRKHASETQQAEIPDDKFDVVIVNMKIAFEALYADVDAGLARCQTSA